MPNSIKYSVGSESLALKKGNFYLGTGDVGKGPTSTTGYYNGVTPPDGGYTIYLNKASGGPSIYTCANDAELISLTNQIAGASYATANQCLTYYAGQTDKMCVNRDYEGIITDGLVLNLDAGFTPSYPKDGTTWYDVGGSNNGTLINGPTFDLTNGGSIVFDGSNDIINLASSNNLTGNNLQNMTVEMWLKYTSTSVMYAYSIKRSSIDSTLISITCNQDVGGSQGRLGFLVRNYNDTNHEWITHNGGYNDGNWHHICGVIDGTNRILYIDGSQKNSSTGGIQSVSNNTAIATIGGFATSNITFNGNISSARFYRKSLTPSEVLQNYNAQKGRFGL